MIDLQLILDADKRVQVGNFFVTANDYPTALSMFESALDVAPQDMDALCNFAYMLLKTKQVPRAEFWIREALKLQPEHAHALGIYALIAQASPNSDRYDIASMLFERALRIEPNDVTRLVNYAYMLQLIGDYPRALEMYTRARDINTLDMHARFHRAMCLMTMAHNREQWKEALDEYEIRHILYGSGNPITGGPMYTGLEESEGKTLLIVCEQGIGDAVMMARYARMLKLHDAFRFKRVYLLCRPEWVGLLSHVASVDGVYSDPASVPAHDFYVPAFSLLRATAHPTFRMPISPYLRGVADSNLPDTGKLKIGLCWQGNPRHDNDKYRSIGADIFCETFADIEGAEFYGLQKPEDNRFRLDFVKDAPVSSLETLASVISDMDLVVTVDTSVLHIAGAMGVPVFGLIPSNPDWRWGTGGYATDWYPSAKLFRATEPLAWKGVLRAVRDHVERFVEE